MAQSLWYMYMCKFIVHSMYMESIHCMATSTNASVGTVHCHLLLEYMNELTIYIYELAFEAAD